MTLTTGLLIGNLMLLVVILIILLAYLGPIFREVKLILQDSRTVSKTLAARVEKIDDALGKASSVLNFFDKATSVVDKVGNIGKKKKRRKKSKYEDEE